MKKLGRYGRFFWLCVVSAFFRFAISGLAADGTEALNVYSLEECIEIGLERSGRLKNALRDRRIGDTSVGQVRARMLPGMSVSGSYMRMDELDKVEFGEQTIEMGALNRYSVSFGARQLLYSGGSVRAGLRAAKDFRKMMDHEYAKARAGLIRDIRMGFADLLLLESVVEVHERSVEQLRDLERQTEERFRAERASEFDLLNARVQAANAIPDLIRAKNDFSLAKTAFRNLIDIEDEDFAVSGALEHEPFGESLDDMLELAFMMRPELSAMERMVDLRAADVRAEQGSYLPSIYLAGAYNAQDPPGTIASGSGWEWRWNAGVEARWDILDGGLRRHTVARKKIEYDKAVEDMRMLVQDVELQVRSAFSKISHAAEAVAVSGENVALAERSLEIAETRYRNGLITRLEFTDINLALLRARLNRLRALREHNHAVSEMGYAVGWYALDE